MLVRSNRPASLGDNLRIERAEQTRMRMAALDVESAVPKTTIQHPKPPERTEEPTRAESTP
jgi:hypothetical protein